ncbi:hypothetical protein HDF10_001771 [Edaphobacter lichenicola]|uniref:Uncharacterized protein n=1 Tax=Tunturiibacter lichenicola TaxID=2051959 RepID=A0A7W8J7B3_9BACT|nr:hypothetical protein [Edaphobacter lichenicola]
MSNISLNIILSRTVVLRFLFVMKGHSNPCGITLLPVHAMECKVGQEHGRGYANRLRITTITTRSAELFARRSAKYLLLHFKGHILQDRLAFHL